MNRKNTLIMREAEKKFFCRREGDEKKLLDLFENKF